MLLNKFLLLTFTVSWFNVFSKRLCRHIFRYRLWIS